MNPPRLARKAPVLGIGLSLAASLTFAPSVLAYGDPGLVDFTPAEPAETFETVATVQEATADELVILPPPETAAPSSVHWQPEGVGSKVLLDGKVVLRFLRDDGTVANRLAQRLQALKRQGALRSDKITPGRRGSRFTVNAGSATLLEIDEAFARRQGTRPGPLTLGYVNALRQALGGVPIQVQASRGLLPGARTGLGLASWYGGMFHGRRAASGERFDMHSYTAAHRTLPFGTLLLVTNVKNGKTALVRVTDRGPYSHGRSLDLSRAAASALGMLGSGVARVRYTVLK